MQHSKSRHVSSSEVDMLQIYVQTQFYGNIELARSTQIYVRTYHSMMFAHSVIISLQHVLSRAA